MKKLSAFIMLSFIIQIVLLLNYSSVLAEGGDTCLTATEISVNSYEYAGLNMPGDLDYFYFTLPLPGNVTIYGRLSGEILEGYLYNATCSSIIASGYLSSYNFIDVASLSAGTYRLKIEGNYYSTVGNYWINVAYQGSSTSPEIDVKGNGYSIVDGDTSSSGNNNTLFDYIWGNRHTFTIINTGTAELNLNGTPRVSISGTHAGDFCVTEQPDSSVAIGGTTIFEVAFQPTAEGLRQATISIANDDDNENPYNFSITGDSSFLMLYPEIVIQGNGQEIINSDTTPTSADGTDFGAVEVAIGSVIHTFSIVNRGGAKLNLTDTPIVRIIGTAVVDFSVALQPKHQVAIGSMTTFEVVFQPHAEGLCEATISIANDDNDEDPYEFIIQGNGIDLDTDYDDDGTTENQGDCDDTNANIHPNATEICGDSIDQDCSGADLSCSDVDNDGDGYTENQGDCDDININIHPYATEIPNNGIDEDCNSDDLIDVTLLDQDEDGFTPAQGDCNDGDNTVQPEADEICGDNIDQNCDGADLSCNTVDKDGDGYSEIRGDCNDEDSSVNPGASEITYNGKDDDCNSATSDDDLDQDGYELAEDCDDGNPSVYPGAKETCSDGIDQDCNSSDLICPEDTDGDNDGQTDNQGDCNDADATIHMGATEICGDGIDQDCDNNDIACPTVSLTTEYGQIISVTIPKGTLSLQDADVTPPEDLNFIYPPMDISILNIAIGETIDITINIYNALPVGASVYKLIDGTWVNFEAYCQYNSERTSITFQITDGGYGDNDHATNGKVSDPIGIAATNQNTSQTPAVDSSNISGDGSSDGSCFIGYL